MDTSGIIQQDEYAVLPPLGIGEHGESIAPSTATAYIDFMDRILSEANGDIAADAPWPEGAWEQNVLTAGIAEEVRASIRHDARLVREAAESEHLDPKSYMLKVLINGGSLSASVEGVQVNWDELFQDAEIMDEIHVTMAESGLVCVLISDWTIDAIIDKVHAKRTNWIIGGSQTNLGNGGHFIFVKGDVWNQDSTSVLAHEVHHRIFATVWEKYISNGTREASMFVRFVDEWMAYMTESMVLYGSTKFITLEKFLPSRVRSFIYKTIIAEAGGEDPSLKDIRRVGKKLLSMAAVFIYADDRLQRVDLLTSAILLSVFRSFVRPVFGGRDLNDDEIAAKISRELADTVSEDDVVSMVANCSDSKNGPNEYLDGLCELLVQKGAREEDARKAVLFFACIGKEDDQAKRAFLAQVLHGGSIEELLTSPLTDSLRFVSNMYKMYREQDPDAGNSQTNIAASKLSGITQSVDTAYTDLFETIIQYPRLDPATVLVAISIEEQNAHLTRQELVDFIGKLHDEQGEVLSLERCELAHLQRLLGDGPDFLKEYVASLNEQIGKEADEATVSFFNDGSILRVYAADTGEDLFMAISSYHMRLLHMNQVDAASLSDTERRQVALVKRVLRYIVKGLA